MNNNKKTFKLTALGLLTALVVVLQFFVRIPLGAFSLSTVLIPIVVGAALFGTAAGAWLGLVFGVVVLISGDATLFLGLNAPGAIIVVIVKGIACGAASGLVYRLLYKKNPGTASVAASVTAPVVNTSVFIIGCLIFFDYGIKYILTVFVGLNFFVELAFNLIMSSAVLLIIKEGRKGRVRGV